MAVWSDCEAHAKLRGALALELYVVHATPAQGADEVQANLPDHLDYQRSLDESGQLAFAGPVSNESGELMLGAGMLVYRADSPEAARKLAEANPMHASGARVFTLNRWPINEGSLTLSVGLSTKSLSMR